MRTVNRLGGILLGLILLALGLVTVVETIALTVWHRSVPLPVRQWRRDLMAVPWSDNRVLAVSIIVFVVGLLMLLSQLRRVPPRHLSTAWSETDDMWLLQRRSVERRAVAAAKTVRGVDSASASTAGKQDHWRLAVTTKAVGNVVDSDQVEERVRAKMHDIGVPDDTPVRVTVRRAKSRA